MGKDIEERVTQRYGSHYDILPKLVPFAVKKDVSYLAIGNNLLDTTRNDMDYCSFNEKQLLVPEGGDMEAAEKRMKARQLLIEIYYQQCFRQQNNK